MLKKLLLLSLALVLILISIALVRTFMHVAPQLDSVERSEVQIDKINVSNNLAASIRFKTISHQDPKDFVKEEFNAFIKWASVTYPEFHSQMQQEQLEYTLLYKWQGSDPSLAPILLTGHYDVVPVIPGTEEIWEQDPFAGAISNNRIWGRGALDDKSGVIGMYEAATYLIKKKPSAKKNNLL